MAEFQGPDESDWADEDLLTHDEAGARLREEIAAEEALIERAGGDPLSPAVRRAEPRLAAMRRRLERIDVALPSGVGTCAASTGPSDVSRRGR
jgi:hypothetical protein